MEKSEKELKMAELNSFSFKETNNTSENEKMGINDMMSGEDITITKDKYRIIDDEYDITELAEMKRNSTVLSGHIKKIKTIRLPNKKGILVEREVLEIKIGEKLTGYCPIDEAGTHIPRNRNGNLNATHFIAQDKPLVITHLNEEVSGYAVIVSIKKAIIQLSHLLKESFEDENLKNKFYGFVSTINYDNHLIIVEVEGVPVAVPLHSWALGYADIHSIDIGTPVELKIERFIEKVTDEGEVYYSFYGNKKDLDTDYFMEFHKLPRNTPMSGKVVRVDPIKGILIEIDNGVVVKGVPSRNGNNLHKLTKLDAEQGTSVQVRKVFSVDKIVDGRQVRHGQVTITHFPKGTARKNTLWPTRLH